MRFTAIIYTTILCISCAGIGGKKAPVAAKKAPVPVAKTMDFSASSIARLDGYWNYFHQRTHYSGVTLIAHNDSIYTWAAGRADSATLLDLNMPMQIASISKTFCASAIMILYSKGKLKLTDSLRHFFPQLRYYNISIEQLLSHGSGLPEYTWFTDKYWHDSLGQLDNQELIELMARENPEKYFAPGRKHHYCNTNFVLLASVVEKVSGLSYPIFLRKHIFDPLGMQNTAVLPPDFPVINLQVKGHHGDGKIFEEHYQDGTYGDKNIISTAWDLYLFYKGLRTNKLFPEVIKNEMFHARWPNARRGTGYALGWRIRTVGEEVWMFHSGWWHGFRTNFYFSLKDDKCAITLCNRLSGGFIPGATIIAMFNDSAWAKHTEKWGWKKPKVAEKEE